MINKEINKITGEEFQLKRSLVEKLPDIEFDYLMNKYGEIIKIFLYNEGILLEEQLALFQTITTEIKAFMREFYRINQNLRKK